jgi:hypothetical protein
VAGRERRPFAPDIVPINNPGPDNHMLIVPTTLPEVRWAGRRSRASIGW